MLQFLPCQANSSAATTFVAPLGLEREEPVPRADVEDGPACEVGEPEQVDALRGVVVPARDVVAREPDGVKPADRVGPPPGLAVDLAEHLRCSR